MELPGYVYLGFLFTLDSLLLCIPFYFGFLCLLWIPFLFWISFLLILCYVAYPVYFGCLFLLFSLVIFLRWIPLWIYIFLFGYLSILGSFYVRYFLRWVPILLWIPFTSDTFWHWFPFYLGFPLLWILITLILFFIIIIFLPWVAFTLGPSFSVGTENAAPVLPATAGNHGQRLETCPAV